MISFQPIELQTLVEKIKSFPKEWRDDALGRSYLLGLSISGHFLGGPWMEKNVSPEIRKPGFLRVGDTSALSPQEQAWRIGNLGELLFNLQHVPGFEAYLRDMRTESPEPRIAELQVARMLFVNEARFRFVDRVGEKGKDYDYEITTSFGQLLCADTKCKIESTPLSAATIRNKLVGSKKQFPKNRPGTYFIKLPDAWLRTSEFERVTTEVATEFLKCTQRIVSVVFYSEPVEFYNGMIATTHAYKEVMNTNHRFDPTQDWHLFNKWNPRRHSANAMPPKWVRLRSITENGYEANKL